VATALEVLEALVGRADMVDLEALEVRVAQEDQVVQAGALRIPTGTRMMPSGGATRVRRQGVTHVVVDHPVVIRPVAAVDSWMMRMMMFQEAAVAATG
jgi:hypothetical protein